MKHFLLFLAGMAAALIFIANLGPMLLLGVSIWLLYLIFKQFIKTDSVFAKICWVILGLIVLSIGVSNIYAVIGIGAAFVLYLVYKHWKSDPVSNNTNNDDPFTNFENEWGEFTK